MDIKIIYHTVTFVSFFVASVQILHDILNFEYTKVKKKYILWLSIPVLIGIVIAGNVIDIYYLPIIHSAVIFVLICAVFYGFSFRVLAAFILVSICICQIRLFLNAIMWGVLYFAGWKIALFTLNGVNSILAMIIVMAATRIYKRFGLNYHLRVFGKTNWFIWIEAVILLVNFFMVALGYNYIKINRQVDENIMTFIVLSVISLIFVVFGFFLYGILVVNRKYREITDLYSSYLKEQAKYYEGLKAKETEIRKIRHDMKNHLGCVSGMLQQKEYKRAESYLREITDRLDEIKFEKKSGNELIDVILSEQQQNEEKYNIEIVFQGKLPEITGVKDYDLCTIFSNLLINAVEACQKIDGKKIIKIAAGYFNGYINIVMENPYMGNQFRLVTGKRDRENHGFGIKNIKEYVERNQGDIKITCQEHKVRVDVVIKS